MSPLTILLANIMVCALGFSLFSFAVLNLTIAYSEKKEKNYVETAEHAKRMYELQCGSKNQGVV